MRFILNMVCVLFLASGSLLAQSTNKPSTKPNPKLSAAPKAAKPVVKPAPGSDDTASALSREAGEHPIDTKLNTCLEKNPSTAGMIQCLDEAYRAWDGLLNTSYNGLLATLKPAQQTKLRNLQRQWITFRDAEFAFINDFYPTQGTMWVPVRMSERVDVVKSRALQLSSYLESLKTF
ncbi:MAG TPA: DUF1311 domain-containing protein [Rhodothermales bacterium]|nr:DUF1311 domain-containing protein [Rhodothermales bacterium]HRR08899.1 DUF1311 domain-containing protein [Rhodothermales bacterium]